MTTFLEYETDLAGRRLPPASRSVKQTQRDDQAERQRAEEAERSRLSRRGQAKQKLAEAGRAELQRQQAVGTIAEINARKERLAASHVEAAKPIQERLKLIEAKQIEAIKRRMPTCPDLESERETLLARIREMNVVLAAAVQREDSLLATVQDEYRQAAEDCNTCLIISELINLASPQATVAMQVARSSVQWAKARLASAAERHLERATPFIVAELALAQRLAAEAEQAERDATQAAIDE